MQALENEFAPRRRDLLTMQNDLKARREVAEGGCRHGRGGSRQGREDLRDQQREFSRKAGEFQDDASTRRTRRSQVQRYLVSEIQAYANARATTWCW